MRTRNAGYCSGWPRLEGTERGILNVCDRWHRTNCSGWPRLEGTESRTRFQSARNSHHIAVAGPDWRGLKGFACCTERGVGCYCSGWPRLEGTERQAEILGVFVFYELQWLAPIGGD